LWHQTWKSLTMTAPDFYISPGGSDANPGTREATFATFAWTQSAVRTRLAECPGNCVGVAIGGGHYYLNKTLVFGLEDGGGTGTGITIKGVNHWCNNIITHMSAPSTLRGLMSSELTPIQGSVVQRNVVCAVTPAQAFHFLRRLEAYGAGPDPLLRDCHADYDVYWWTAAPDMAAAQLRSERVHGIELNSCAEDPMFIDPEHDDFRLREGSPALSMNIESIDVSRTGPRITTPSSRVEMSPC
jgi:hypothetical protein